MKPDEKFCPLCNMTCKGEECGWWRHPGCCAVTTIAISIRGIDLEISRVVDELFCIRKELEDL